MDRGGTSDPYVQFEAKQLFGFREKMAGKSRDKKAAYRTSTIRKTLEPAWENSDVPPLITRDIDLDDQLIHLMVMDHDKFSTNDLCGHAALCLEKAWQCRPEPVQFDLPLEKETNVQVQITGTVAITTHWGAPTDQQKILRMGSKAMTTFF